MALLRRLLKPFAFFIQLFHIIVGLAVIIGLGASCWQAVTTSISGPVPGVALFAFASFVGLTSAFLLMTFLGAIWIHLAALVEWLDDWAHRSEKR